MRTITEYRPARSKRWKSLFLTALLLTMAFLAGAIAEKTVHFLQDVKAALPAAQEEIKVFFRERVIFKLQAVADQVKWAAVITLLIVREYPSSLIRGP